MHGARVELAHGSYDDTVVAARSASAKSGHWYCPDTAGFDADAAELAFVVDVTAGYVTLFRELLDQLGRGPDVLFIQAGVGGLAAGAALALDVLAPATRIVTVEPWGSNCVQASIAAGEPRTVPDQSTMMAGLRCQSVSAAAWRLLRARVSVALTVRDADAAGAMRVLAAHGIVGRRVGCSWLGGRSSRVAVDRSARPPGHRSHERRRGRQHRRRDGSSELRPHRLTLTQRTSRQGSDATLTSVVAAVRSKRTSS
jgi:diaminopropionate ammonia-lyase